MQEFFTTLFYQPIFNLLIWLYDILPTHDLGLSILLLTIVVKTILLPLSLAQIRAQRALQELQPHLEDLKTKHKDDKAALAQAQMQLFSEKKINPLASCIPLLIQLPFLFALFYVLSEGLKNGARYELLYPFVANPGALNETFLGWFSLVDKGNIVLAALNGIGQFVQVKMIMPAPAQKKEGAQEDMAAMMNKQMMFLMPIMIGVMSYSFPNGIGVYFLAQTLLQVAFQAVVYRKK